MVSGPFYGMIFGTPWAQSFIFLGKGFCMTPPFIGMLVLCLSWMVLGGIDLLLSQLISYHLRTVVMTTFLIPLERMLYLGHSLRP